MDIKTVEVALRDYNRKKAIIETTLLRIESFKEAINNPDCFTHVFLGSPREPGMPRGTSRGASPVEIAVSDKECAIELLKSWIEDDRSRILPYQIETEQLDAALIALNKQQRYIVECKYFEDMFWRDIEVSFNSRFRGPNYITSEGLRRVNRQALETMTGILKPYFMRFKIKK